ncbi:hypothetical protein RB614_32070 [Phytohabitans sp. ZYX-F-186]|uniref:Uncharacterized protein n=1 Tax=Phytohabitans maris TaxID=3071409 RepID=A0ABU0ZQ54_9ACTN|nr:hypothetical protein [Phytohabitans sp. ZYX-F-186]MDQ7909168.1 hypothetical protein [Phytohabitans sp. ZYX-F-186]
MSEDVPAEVARLRNAISCELYAQLALRGETIDQAAVPEVAYAVAMRLREAFTIEWAPRWDDDPDDDGSLGLDAAVFHASAVPAADRYPIFDHGWPRH